MKSADTSERPTTVVAKVRAMFLDLLPPGLVTVVPIMTGWMSLVDWFRPAETWPLLELNIVFAAGYLFAHIPFWRTVDWWKDYRGSPYAE